MHKYEKSGDVDFVTVFIYNRIVKYPKVSVVMERRFRLSTALDIDDVLMECVPYAIRLANEKYNFDPPITQYEVDHWGKLGTRADVIFEFFDDPEFFRNQPVIKGAKEFVRKLSGMTEVFVSTSIRPEFMGIRAQRIMEEFPEIPADHIYMGSRKDKIDVDILFDDGMHNVFRSNAAYPILMRRPWNREATGMLAVNTYDEFLKLVEIISDSYSVGHTPVTLDRPGVVVLVGPSGSGKNEIADIILQSTASVEKLRSYTTESPETDGKSRGYHCVSLEDFHAMNDRGELFESTVYAHKCYGSRKKDVEDILARGKHVLTVMDICGAMALKTHFDNVVTIYTKREKRDLLAAILNKDSPVEDKVNRLLSIEAEGQNAAVCDFTVKVDSPEDAARQICNTLGIK